MLLLRRNLIRLLRMRNLLAITIVLLLLYIIKLMLNLESQAGTCSVVTVTQIHSKSQATTVNLTRLASILDPVHPCTTFEYFTPNSTKKIDWHNYTQMSLEAQRKGAGEHGEPVTLSANDMQSGQQLFYLHGFNALLSEKITLDRSLPDLRHPGCKKRLYIESLPSVSVIIPFYNEHWSTLLRSVHSVLNRSPAHIVKEVLLVEDGSLNEILKQKLDDYVSANLTRVTVVHLPERVGMIGARLAGAARAAADVLVFFASHAEASDNWLPPLLEPIALDHKVLVFPYTDVIMQDTFEYRAQDEGARGAFDWEFFYKRLPVLPKDQANMPEPFESPVMAGNVFAISRAYFWELGGHDPGMRMLGGEQYELSFKIWMCGGRVLNAPCSRVGHIFSSYFVGPHLEDYISKNFRRVADVWMDEYSEHVYHRLPHLRRVHPGDIRRQLLLRHTLRCKTFRWYMTQIAFDVPPKYPPVLPKPFAKGQIRPLQDPTLCLDACYGSVESPLQMRPCLTNASTTNDTRHAEQWFEFSWYKDIRSTTRHIICLDAPDSAAASPVLLYVCHMSGGNQEWRYNVDTKQIFHVSQSCLDYNVTLLSPCIMPCDPRAPTQQWTVDIVHQDRMAKWDERLKPVTGPVPYSEEVV